jgi:hypothetical protein
MTEAREGKARKREGRIIYITLHMIICSWFEAERVVYTKGQSSQV